VIHAVYDFFSFTPLLAAPFSENFGFIPMLLSLALIVYWVSGVKRGNII
jgi:hypothetical protein